MTDFFQTTTDIKTTLEDIFRTVHSFSGYLEKQDRRAADELLRKHLVRVFEEQLTEFDRVKQRLMSASGLTYMERVQGIDTKLRTFIDRIQTAARGYAGVFDAVKVKE